MGMVAEVGYSVAHNTAGVKPLFARKWQAYDEALLKRRFVTHEPVRTIAFVLDRSVGSVRSKARRLGLRRPPRGVPQSRPFLLTPLGGRQTVWSDERVERLVRLWVANFHHTTISLVLGVPERAAVSKANRISLPPRFGLTLSRDLEQARRVDFEAAPIPKEIKIPGGRKVIGKLCNLTGNWFYAPAGSLTSVEAQKSNAYRLGACEGMGQEVAAILRQRQQGRLAVSAYAS